MESDNQVPEQQIPQQPITQPSKSKNKKIAGITMIVFIALVFIISGLILAFNLSSKKEPPATDTATVSKDSEIAPKTTYSNPFDKSTQYVNPFFSYKNPFDNLK
ncbi:MAG: hypothetical protein HYW63_04470 [Candidatus Levybacteria bacterium]|nr:hypothetical protein [Candidatus Levybacteria bacterium]